MLKVESPTLWQFDAKELNHCRPDMVWIRRQENKGIQGWWLDGITNLNGCIWNSGVCDAAISCPEVQGVWHKVYWESDTTDWLNWTRYLKQISGSKVVGVCWSCLNQNLDWYWYYFAQTRFILFSIIWFPSLEANSWWFVFFSFFLVLFFKFKILKKKK